MQPGIPAIPFALVPAQATHDVIDYCTREGQLLFRSATQNLYSESSEMFDCDPDGLMDFIQLSATAAAPAQAGHGGGGGPAPGGGGVGPGGSPGGGGGGGGGGPPGGGPAPVQPGIPAIPFALVPTQATHDVIDYRTRKSQSLFRSATQNL